MNLVLQREPSLELCLTMTTESLGYEVQALQHILSETITTCLIQQEPLHEVLCMCDNLQESAMGFRKVCKPKKHLWSRFKKNVLLYSSSTAIFALLLLSDLSDARRY